MNYFAHDSAIIDEPAHIGKGTKIWHFSHVMPGAQIGKNCNIGQNVFIASKVQIGDGVKIQNNVSLYDGLQIADEVFIGPSVVFTNVINPRAAIVRQSEYLPTHIGKGASIGANATIICGNKIGAYAFIGAGAVVTKAVRAYALVVGNAAKQIGWVSEFGHRLHFDAAGFAICEESKQQYQLQNNSVSRIA
jgi:UDP-2-acetamido-3-amino-2,3-dideoxy-glucuronate N-acetyltransferase